MNQEFIERHSRQLILPGWSLALQEEITGIKISIPENKFMCMYLCALGVRKFHLQDCNDLEKFFSSIPNWENDNIIIEEISEADYIIYLNKQDYDSNGRLGTIAAYSTNSKLLVKSYSSIKKDENKCEFTINENELQNLEVGTILALFFSNIVKVNHSPHYSST